ncbi:MAG: cadherin domain-containing protein [bacterium]|nr:cadherin domain-containing protein [bacterium]
MKIKNLLTLLLVVFAQKLLLATAPTWSVNPASFAYSMTVTAVANVNCADLENPSNRVAAFVNGVCRGTALTSTVVGGKYIASMVVYSNTTSGDTVVFKVYNSVSDLVYDAVVSVSFQDNASFGVTTSPYIIKNNNAPSAIGLSNNSVPESIAIAGTVGNFSTTDADLGQTFTYTLVSGTGSTDNSKFSIVSGQLKTAVALNFSVQNSHSIRIRSVDNLGCSVEQTFNILVTDVNTPPTQILLSDTSINENSPILTSIGSFSAIDNDFGDTYTFALVSGTGSTDNASFNINGTSLRSSAQYNYEVKNSYSIRVKVTDGANNTFERTFIIIVKDVNDAPTNILINGNTIGSSFMENKPVGAAIATLSSIDEDASNTFSYTFISTAGNNNNEFSIIGNQLRTNAAFDYETRQSYVIFVQTNDGLGGIFTKQLSLTVTDSNDAPTAINLTNTSVQENSASKTFVSKLSGTDPDATSNFAYSLVSGTGSSGNGSFSISNDSLYTAMSFDYETKLSYSIRLNVNDGFGGTFQQVFTINVIDANDVPTNIDLTSNQIQENSAANTVIGSFSSLDQDASNTFVYALVSGIGSTDNNNFNISGNNLRSLASFDYETKSSYSIRIRTTDNGGQYFEKVFAIQITDAIDVPTNITISNDSISENLTTNFFIGNLGGVTQDVGASFVYSFNNSISGNDNASFIISGAQLKSNASFDYETKSTYNVYVTASVGSASYTKLIQVFIRNQNDAPTDISLSLNTIKENRPINSYIGSFYSTDADLGNTFTYALASGIGATDNSYFRISNDSLYTQAVLNFEVQNSFSIRVRTTDNAAGQFSKVFSIMVSDSNDVPTGLFLSASAVQENQSVGTAIATLSTADADAGQTFTYSLVGGLGSTHNSSFYIQGGQIKANAVFDFEQQNIYKVRIQTNDGNGGTFADTFSIYVLNLNDAPTQIALSNALIKENRPANTILGTFTTTDQDLSDVFVYSFDNVTGNDNNAFYINGNQLRSNFAFNYEAKQIYNIYVQSSDGLASVTKQFLITILDSNDAPTSLSLSNNTISENLASSTFISTLNSDDVDAAQSFNYSLVAGLGSNNNANFRISNDSLYSNAVFNFEAKSAYSIRIRTTDNGLLSFEKQFEIVVNNANDNPTDISLSSNEITENKISRTFIGSLSTADQDVANNFGYSLVTGVGSTDNSAFIITAGELRSNRIFNYEQQKSFNIRIQTNDGNGGSYEKAFTIFVMDSNDAPSNIVLSTNIIAENLPIGSKVCEISTIDQDTNDAFLYSFANVQGNSNSNFLIIGNELRSNAIFDFETKNFYIIVLNSTDAAGATYTKQFVINIKDSVDAPTALDISNNSVAENEATDAYVGTLNASDADQFSGFTYTLVSGAGSTNNNSFKISNDSVLTVSSFDFEIKKSYSIRVRVTDATNASFEKAIAINILDANDAPTQVALSNNKLSENKAILTEIGALSTSDVDANDLHNYSLVSGTGSTDNALFIIADNKLLSNFTANYEVKNSYSLRIATTDKGASSYEAIFVINIVDVGEKPSIDTQSFSMNENSAIGTLVGTIVSNSPDAGANLVYSILYNTDLFAIEAATGKLSNKTILDYEKGRKYQLTVVVKDNQLQAQFDTAVITVNIVDEIETKQELPANNYMSPNNDGINDYFVVENVELYVDYSLTIFNEMGMQVYFKANSYQNDWDGTYEGNNISAGVYFYVFKNNKTGGEFKGALNITK